MKYMIKKLGAGHKCVILKGHEVQWKTWRAAWMFVSLYFFCLFLPKFLLTYDLITLAVGRENQHERNFSVFFYLSLLKFLTILIDDIITSVVWSEFIL